jgi:hypothetical protein
VGFSYHVPSSARLNSERGKKNNLHAFVVILMSILDAKEVTDHPNAATAAFSLCRF